MVRYLSDFQSSMSADEVRFFEVVVGIRPRREAHAVPKKARREIMAIVRHDGDKLRRDVVEQHRAAGIEGFREAVREGVLDVHAFRQISLEGFTQVSEAASGRGRHSGLASAICSGGCRYSSRPA